MSSSLKVLISILLLSVCATMVSAQNDTLETEEVEKTFNVLQFSGVLVTGDSLQPVPYSNVYRKRDNTGVITNNLGFFTLPAFEGDTIVFSNIGYTNMYYAIPRGLEENTLSIVQIMTPDTVQLGVTDVYPWPSRQDFKSDFLALQLGDNDLARIQRNLDPTEMKKRIQYLGPESSTSYRYAVNNEILSLQRMGTAQNISLLDPFAWAQFIRSLGNGSLRRK